MSTSTLLLKTELNKSRYLWCINIVSMNNYQYFRPQMSLYIPSVTTLTTEEQIRHVFQVLNIGVVSRVDFVEKDKDSSKFMAFVHFEYWFINDTSYHLQERIFNTGNSRIIYNDPHYWIVMENKNPRTQNEVAMEKEMIELKKRIGYLEKVMETTTRKFMDNGIVTKGKNCDRCWVEMNESDEACKACGYGEDDNKSDVTDPDMPELESVTPTINLRDALRTAQDVTLESSNDVDVEQVPPIPVVDEIPQQPVTTSWSLW